MHKEILSSQESKMLQSFLNGEKTNDSFRVLKYRIKSYHEKLQQDLILIEKALQRF